MVKCGIFVPPVDDKTLDLGNANVVTPPRLPVVDHFFSDLQPSVLGVCALTKGCHIYRLGGLT